MIYVDVILPLPLEGLFTYSVPEAFSGRVAFGIRVQVPFGMSNKSCTAMVVCRHGQSPQGFTVKNILSVVDEAPMLIQQQMKLWQWMAEYYLSTLGDVYKAAMPAGLKTDGNYKPKMELNVRLAERFRSEQALHVAMNLLQRSDKQMKAFTTYLELSHWDSIPSGISCQHDGIPSGIADVSRDELMNTAHVTNAIITALVGKGILELYQKEIGRLNDAGTPHPEHIKPLSTPQQRAYEEILESMKTKNVTLLHGVTSSGKTEIYIHLIQREIEQGRQVLYLLPEIALTVQIMNRLKNVFGRRLGIYHSKYSDAERVEIWKKQLSDHPYDVILGARSAVFLPFQRLGLVIIDEEHETSFKQQDPSPRYHARSVAIILASLYGAKTLLGTATPCVETYQNAKTGKYGYVALTQRYKGIELPEFQIVDIRDLRHRKMMTGPFSPQLLKEVRQALESGKQAILFQNRRGFSPMIECRQCGWVPRCQNCDVSLTYHKNMNVLTCHYCGATYPVPTHCPSCESKELRSCGYGTEKIEDAISDIFPEAKVARMDLDTTRSKNAYGHIIADFAAGRTNILIGTQMISKGLDFENVSVVGILNADSMLDFPDFRAYEHAFMMMAQVGGRAGRKGRRGLVVLQTKSPDLPIVRQVVDNDYAAMFRGVMEERGLFHYPPFYRLVYVFLKHKDDRVVDHAAHDMGHLLRQWFGGRVLGPDKPSVSKVKTLHIRKMMLKLEAGIPLQQVRDCLRRARRQMAEDKRYATVTVYYDVDPL